MPLASEVRGLSLSLVQGTGIRVRRYPVGAVGVTLTSDGVAYVYPVGANVKAFIAANNVKANWRYFGIEPFTPSAVASEYFILLGAGAAAGSVLTLATALLEVVVSAITVATGAIAPHYFPYAPTVVRDDTNDGALAGLCTTNGAADTLTCGALLATGLGT